MPVSARLIDTPVGTPADLLRSAEARFLRELERLLGDDLARTLRAFEDVQESSAEDLSKDETREASRWAAAFDKARLAGMRELGDVGGGVLLGSARHLTSYIGLASAPRMVIGSEGLVELGDFRLYNLTHAS